MRVLIVEDNAFNAFCLTRLLQASFPAIQVTVVDDSISAQQLVESDDLSLVILDGDLGVGDGLLCNGPALADTLWHSNSLLRIVAWSDSETMRQAFAEVFKRHKKMFNDLSCWPKIVSQERIRLSLNHLFSQQYSTQHSENVRVDILHA